MRIVYALYNNYYNLDNNYMSFGHNYHDIGAGCITLWIYSLLYGYMEKKLTKAELDRPSTLYTIVQEQFSENRVLFYGRIDTCKKEASCMTANKCRSLFQSAIDVCEKRKQMALQEINKKYGISNIKEFK